MNKITNKFNNILTFNMIPVVIILVIFSVIGLGIRISILEDKVMVLESTKKTLNVYKQEQHQQRSLLEKIFS